jgi:hypothetical protein
MAKKMYYTEEEAIAKLGVTSRQLQEFVRQQKLRAYADGAKKMYKVEEVDVLAAKTETGEIELMPVSPEGSDVLSLSETGEEKPPAKEDTVLTGEGVSIFDDEDLEIEAADSMAKTHPAPGGEDQVAIEGVGSGSGLLDLTRESDDTSLGPGVLEQIDMEEAVGSSIAAAEIAAVPEPQNLFYGAPPVFVEAVDASAGLFTGIAAFCSLMVLLLVALTIATVAGFVPSLFEKLKDNVMVLIIGGVVVAVMFGVVGMLMGKSIAAKQEAMRKLGR